MGFVETLVSTYAALSKGQMDFVGQTRAKNTMMVIIYLSTGIGFLHGWSEERFSITFRWSLSGYVLANVLCFLSWPFWNMNPTKFQDESAGQLIKAADKKETEGKGKADGKPKKKK